MAETCKLLSPEKLVLCPDLNAGCSLADSCKAEDLRKYKEEHPGYQVVSYVNTTAAVKALTDGLRIDVADTAIRVTNLKPGLVETNFSNIRFHGDNSRAANVYKGIKPLTGDDIADTAVYAANAPEHVQIAEVLILATHQASGSVIVRK